MDKANPKKDNMLISSCGVLTLQDPQRALVMRDRGLTLLEVTLGMFFLAIGVLSLLSFLLNLGGLAEDTTRKLYAAFCAQEKMEELKFMLKTSSVNTPQGEETIERPYGSLRRSWKIAAYMGLEGMEEIEVQCDYLWMGKRKGVVLRSLMAP